MNVKFARRALPALMLLLAACAGSGSRGAPAATADLHDASGRSLGLLTVTEAPAGLVLTGNLTGLSPGAHGIHLHATGRCDAPGFDSAGGHWNPAGREHGTDNPAGPHRGDFVNLQAGDGSATVSAVSAGGVLHGADGLLDADGAAVVVHADADDYRTDPSGNSGARIACGVVRGG